MNASTKQSWARGGLIFAGTLMLLIGVYQIFLGIAAIAKDQFFVLGANYAYQIDTTTWGWIHLGIGILVAAAGFFLFTGSAIAKTVAIALVAISAVANFFFLPYYPVWSLLIIALDIFAIWAIATARTGASGDMMTDRGVEAGTYGSAGSYGSGPATGSSDPNRTGERWPSENATRSEAEGRHWAPDNVKEGVGQNTGNMGQGMSETADQARERASAAGRSATGGNQPPTPPTT